MSKLLKNPFTFKAIETRYDGCLFRSRLEARWATFFNTLGIPYEYEKEPFYLDGIRYLPDFWMPEQNCWMEIKGQEPTPEEREKSRRLALYTQKNVATFYGDIQLPNFHKPRLPSFFDRPAMLWMYHTSEIAPGGPSTQQLQASSPILALLQRTSENCLDLHTHEGELVIQPRVDAHTIGDIDSLLELLQQQYQTLSEIKGFLQEQELEIQTAITPADGYDLEFFEQRQEGMVDDAYWGECDTCGTLQVAVPFINLHHCKDTIVGNLVPDSPRLMAAYGAARSARFEWWRK